MPSLAYNSALLMQLRLAGSAHRKGLGLVMFAYGLALLAGAVSGASDPLKPLAPFVASTTPGTLAGEAAHAGFQRVEQPSQLRTLLANARERGQPVMLDFYADWCISCKVMERNVFSDPQVIQALTPYTLLQIDMTDNTPAQQALLDELGLFGPPAILFYRASGTELSDARVLGEMDKQQFLSHLANFDRSIQTNPDSDESGTEIHRQLPAG